jgi:hypothetical protein
LLQPCERRAVTARLSAVFDARDQRAHLRLERLDRTAWPRPGQRPADFDHVMAQSGEGLLIRLLEGADLIHDVMELLFQAPEVASGPSRLHGRRRIAIELALTGGDLGRPVRTDAIRCRRCYGRSGERAPHRFTSGDSPSADHLVQPAIESRQRFGDAVAGSRASLLRAAAPPEAVLREMFDMPRQLVEALVDGSEFIAEHVLVAARPIWFALLPHAFLRSLTHDAGADRPH